MITKTVTVVTGIYEQCVITFTTFVNRVANSANRIIKTLDGTIMRSDVSVPTVVEAIQPAGKILDAKPIIDLLQLATFCKVFVKGIRSWNEYVSERIFVAFRMFKMQVWLFQSDNHKKRIIRRFVRFDYRLCTLGKDVIDKPFELLLYTIDGYPRIKEITQPIESFPMIKAGLRLTALSQMPLPYVGGIVASIL